MKCKMFLIILFALSTTLVAQQPNILFIIADDMGIDAINDYGVNVMNVANTPNLDALRADGVSYMNAWATPQCTTTRGAIMSGKYGVKSGVTNVPDNLDLDQESLFNFVQRMTNNAYADAVIGKWHISNPVNIDHPSQHGLDFYEGIIGGTISDYYQWEKLQGDQFVQVDEYLTSHLTDLASTWIQNQTQPWILWLAHIAPHSPFHAPPAELTTLIDPTTNRELYNASIEALDYEIGELINSLDPEERQNTVIIFIGDNGTPNGVLRGFPSGHGKSSLYEGGIRVPMIISGDLVDRKGAEENGLVQTLDLYATISELCGVELEGGVHNSYSIKASLDQENTIERKYIYSDDVENGLENWAIRNAEYKLIMSENGDQEFYNLATDLGEETNLISSLDIAQTAILEELEMEANAIRTGWSCQDFILNGDEVAIDDCADIACTETDILSDENIGCCDSPDVPSVYYEYQEGDLRNLYSNGFPNHDYCYNTNQIPEQVYHYYRVDMQPRVTNNVTSVLNGNNRPGRHFGIALNGVSISPAPATPFIFTNETTGEFNWDWVFEPTTNQGDMAGQVKLDCATAHTSPAVGYHYHGEMFQYLETVQPGITSVASLDALFQVGWASDGHPIIYKFGPDASGVIKELQPSYQLKSGERPGDGIEAPCGAYTGKFTNDFEYVSGVGDLDECNGIAATITLNTAIGMETFDYFYVVTSDFPQISRCLVGNVSLDFETGSELVQGVDMDGDGYLSQFDCDDSNADVNPSAVEVPNNGFDEDCDGSDLITATHELAGTKLIFYPNPTTDFVKIELDLQLEITARIYTLDGKLILENRNLRLIDFSSFTDGAYILEVEDISSGQKVTERIIKN